MPHIPGKIAAAALLVGLVLWPVASAGAQFGDYTDHPADPEGPVAPMARDLIDAINADDEEAFLAFLDAHATGPFRHNIPREQHVAVYRQLWNDTRGVDYYGYRTYDPPRPANEHVLIVRDRLLGDWHGIVIVLDAAEPTRLAGMQLLPARPPSTLPAEGPLSLAGLRRELDDLLSKLADADAFSGTVMLARDGQVIYQRAVGLASRRFGVSNRIDTKFNLGSMNKMFTAVAIGQLVEAGRLSLDDPLSRFVDESWLPESMTDRIRIRHLLNHTSGLGSYFNDTFQESSRARFRALEDYKPLVRSETLAFEPGTDWRYSNTGFLLLGVVIEKVTGRSYFDVVRAHIFEPAGMADTESCEMDRPVPNLAIGYDPQRDDEGRLVWRNNLFLHVIKGGPAGGGFSTAPDLLRFDVALRRGTLLSERIRDELWRPRPEANSPDYGYGFGIHEGPLGRVVGHQGGFPGISAALQMHLDAGYTVVVLANITDAAPRVARKAGRLLARCIIPAEDPGG